MIGWLAGHMSLNSLHLMAGVVAIFSIGLFLVWLRHDAFYDGVRYRDSQIETERMVRQIQAEKALRRIEARYSKARKEIEHAPNGDTAASPLVRRALEQLRTDDAAAR